MSKTKTPLRQSYFLQKHRYSLFFFLFLVAYHVVISNRVFPWKVNEIPFSFYCVDYSFGFATKLLPGAIYRFFFGAPATKEIATIFLISLLFFFYLGISLFLNAFLQRTPKEFRAAALFFLLFYLTGAYTFAIFSKEIGMIDSFWVYFSLLFFCFIEHKWLRWLIPAFFALSVMIHYAAVINYILLFGIALLYRISIEQNSKNRLAFIAILTVSICITIGLFVFFVIYERQLICPIDVFHQKMKERGSDYFEYFNYAFYDLYDERVFTPETLYSDKTGLSRLISIVFYRIKLNIDLIPSTGTMYPITLIGGFAILSPLLFIIFRFHFNRVRRMKGFLNKFCAFLMLIQFPLTFISGMLFSVDVNRWYTHAFLIAYTLVFVVLWYDYSEREMFFQKVQLYMKTLPANIYFLAYSSISLWPYF